MSRFALATVAAVGLAMTLGATRPAQAGDFECAPAPDPVFSLAYGSRYSDSGSGSRILDEAANEDVDEALDPIDDFLRALTDDANLLVQEDVDRRAIADCVIGRMAVWADADAMADLRSRTSKLTIGSRLGAFALAALQVREDTSRPQQLVAVTDWLRRQQRAQMNWWEDEAPDGAAQGNLRAWSALAGSAIGRLSGDPVMMAWSAWSVAYVACKANPDGSLPQEMSRGKYALHYQLHALAPLVVSAAMLRRQGFDLGGECDGALQRIVGFAVADLENGALTQAITGKVQTYFDGTRDLEGFNLAWAEAYLSMFPDPKVDALVREWRPLSHSKLGGDQTALWANRP